MQAKPGLVCKGFWLASAMALLAVGCLAPVDDGVSGDDPEDAFVVADEDKDNYLSASSAEYIVEGKTRVIIESHLADASAAVKEKRVRELIGYKQVAIAWFLTQYLVNKSAEDSNADYGGMGGLAKNGSFEDLDVTAKNATTYEFTFRQIVAGGPKLISALPTRNVDGVTVFDLEIGTPSNEDLAKLETNNEWYRQAPWSAWDPAKVPASQKTTLTLAITREVVSTDAWFNIKEMIADKVLDIDVHFGWDYHNAYHVVHAKEMFGWLKAQGFAPPVSTFEALTRSSGAFTRTVRANGATIAVQVRLFYGITGGANDPDTDAGGKVLEADMRKSLAKRDVIIFSGHSGPFYGFALANWRKTSEGDLDDSEMAAVEMAKDRYQIVVAEGCDTYQIGEAFRQNPSKKDGTLVDVITTTSFSNASTADTVKDVIRALIARDTSGRLRPEPIKRLLTKLDDNSYWYNSMYGIHGIDNNPTVHPFAKLGKTCQPCSKNADCGDNGNLCVKVGDGGKRCVAACTADRGCGEGYMCSALATGSTIFGQACVPETLSCQ